MTAAPSGTPADGAADGGTRAEDAVDDAMGARDAAESAEGEDPGAAAELSAPDTTHSLPEVTVQLPPVEDSPSGSATEAPSADGEDGDGEGADGEGGEGPSTAAVFVDASGRRGRRFRRLGIAVAVACAGYAAVIAATLLSGNSAAPWLPVPGQDDDKPVGKTHTSPHPSASLAPGLSGPGAASGTGISSSVGATAVPGAGSPSPMPMGTETAVPTAGTATASAGIGPGDSPSASAPSTAASPTPSASGGGTSPSAAPSPTRGKRIPRGRAKHSFPPLPL
ncbi:hypothetical protein ACVB8X_19835 [Streptomyces sp. NRAIS4]